VLSLQLAPEPACAPTVSGLRARVPRYALAILNSRMKVPSSLAPKLARLNNVVWPISFSSTANALQ
jgi:hypothetical protein